jgi:hypothetical protein
LLFEKIKNATDTMPTENRRKDPVFTKTINPISTKANANNPNLSLDIQGLLKNFQYVSDHSRRIENTHLRSKVNTNLDFLRQILFFSSNNAPM